MQDLSSVSRALNEVLDSPVPNEENLVQSIERFLISNDPAVRVAGVLALCDILRQNGTENDAKHRMILEETALMLIPALLPILRDSKEEVQELLTLSAGYGRPREVVLALNEALQHIQERAEGVELSDEGEDWEDVVNFIVLAEELVITLKCYEISISRLPNKKSTSTILALSDAISPVLSSLYQELDAFRAAPNLRAICQLISSTWKWAQTTEDVGGEQKTILVNLLFMAVTLLGPKSDSGMLERWFLQTFPKYDYVETKTFPKFDDLQRKTTSALISTKSTTAGLTLRVALATSQELQVESNNLRDRLINPSSTSPYSALAALILLSVQAIYEDPDPNPPTLADCMPVLSAALSSVDVDAGCTFVWTLVHRGATVDFDSATMLFELLMPLVAIPTNNTTRTALTKLLEAIIQTQNTESKLMLFKQSLEPDNPFESIRLVTFPILRQQITTDPSILSPTTLQILEPIIFTLTTQDDTSVTELELEELVSTLYPSWYTECSNFLWFLYEFDKNNQTGIRDESRLAKIRTEWLGPMKQRLQGWSEEAEAFRGDAVRVRFVIERWSSAVQRALDTIGN